MTTCCCSLSQAVIALGKPTVIVLINGGSVALKQEMAAKNVAIVEAFYPGTRGSEARPALLRSWVVFKVPPILERHILRFKPIGIDSQCRAPLRPPTSTSSVF